MPRYEYQSSDPQHACDVCRQRFEVQQSMTEPPLTSCPQCGGQVERVISLCAVGTQPSERAMLSDRNLKEKGFTKLVNEGGGRFRKTV
jgi:putative FmdB family regulatory protein